MQNINQHFVGIQQHFASNSALKNTPNSSLSAIFQEESCRIVAIGGKRRDDILVGKSRCHALDKSHTKEMHVQLRGADLFEEALSFDHNRKISKKNGWPDIWEMINEVKDILENIGDGDISISAYDTAWVALVRDINGSGNPLFPSSLKWIVDNQLSDGSWGDNSMFVAHDRMINTLACIIALKTWNVCDDKCETGAYFLRENMWRLAGKEAEHMPIGFEVAFPSLLGIAKSLGLDIPYDHPVLQDIYAQRNIKLQRIPVEVMHKVPTTLLHSLEGMPSLEWPRLHELKSRDGSFLFSPSSTAYAFMQTRDEKCLGYLEMLIQRFGGGVPNVYPVDLFEHLWIVDRLQRLGISRFFASEIKKCLDYVYSYWTKDGICWARNSNVRDIDDTSMAFRLLRFHGYNVSADVFQHFKRGGEFVCFSGQSSQAVTGMYNLNRASQLQFPGETMLELAKEYSYRFLKEKQNANRLIDKWIITKDLVGEVKYALDFPWYSSLPRIETRFYLEQYGGSNDVWIGKTLYRMPLVNNDLYLDLAKMDFNLCQSLHQLELLNLHKWCDYCNIHTYNDKESNVVKIFFLASSCIFEPDRATERLGWAKTALLAESISAYFLSDPSTNFRRQAFIDEFLGSNDYSKLNFRKAGGLVSCIRQLIYQLSSEAQSRHYKPQLRARRQLQEAWKGWLRSWSSDKIEDQAFPGPNTPLLLVQTIEICGGRSGSVQSAMAQLEYDHLSELASSICRQLEHHKLLHQDTERNYDTRELELLMRELTKRVLQSSESLAPETRQTFLAVVKSVYYSARCPDVILDGHIRKVLFEEVH